MPPSGASRGWEVGDERALKEGERRYGTGSGGTARVLEANSPRPVRRAHIAKEEKGEPLSTRPFATEILLLLR
jgi:hypothetical protein